MSVLKKIRAVLGGEAVGVFVRLRSRTGRVTVGHGGKIGSVEGTAASEEARVG